MSDERTNYPENAPLLERASRLPHGVVPDRDLWPGIAAQLGGQLPAEEAIAEPGAAAPIRGGHFLSTRWQAPALAASLLLALLVGYWIGREQPLEPESAPLVAGTAAETDENDGLQPVSLLEEVGLLEARRSMAAEIEAGLERLPADARVVVLENLTTINQALDEIDAVLQQAPADGLDRRLLISMYTDQLARLNSVQMLVLNSNQEILL